MGKRKHKHENKRTDKHAQRPLDIAGFQNKGQVENETPCRTSDRQRKDEQEPPMGLRKLAERSSLTDWLLAAFTFVLAAAGIYQFIILNSQLGVMRKDQRPWLKLDFNLNNLAVGQPIRATMHIVNNGKTPARVVWGDMAIERVKNGELARLDYPLPHSRFTTGLVFPNDPLDTPITMMRPSASTAEDELLMQSELEDFQHLKIFFAIYATVYYKDFFGVDHWTKRCVVVGPSNVPGTFTGQNCTNYGDVDAN
jgi:hypothetical protein